MEAEIWSPKQFARDVVRDGAKWSVTRGSNTLKVCKKQRDAAKSEKKSSVAEGVGGVNFGKKRAASRVTEFMNEPLVRD